MEKNPQIQFSSIQDIDSLQNELLKKQMLYIKNNSKYYNELFSKNNLKFDDIK